MDNNNNYNGIVQKPVGSGFSAENSAADVIKGIDLTGKVAIVTGGYAGIGLETTKTLVSAGATVVVPAKDIEKAKRNLADVPNVEIELMNLIDPVSIDTFAAKFLSSERSLHLLINNAGIMFTPGTRDGRGYEMQFATNHLGHFQLTARLWPALVNAKGARVVNVSSWGHHFAKVDFEDPNYQHRDFETFNAYGQSKTANALFTVELDAKGRDFGVRSYSLHPGAIVDTDLKRLVSDEDLKAQGVYDEQGNTIYDVSKGLKTIAQGASTSIWAATSSLLNNISGVYCENNDVAVLEDLHEPTTYSGSASLAGVAAYVLDPEDAKKLWLLSEQLTGVEFSI